MNLAHTINSFVLRLANLRLVEADAGYHPMHDLSVHGWHFGPIMWVLAIALVAVAFVLAIRRLK